MNAVGELKDLIERGLVPDIFAMERSYFLLREISDRADELSSRNNGNFGMLFGAFQSALQTEAVLATSRLYDTPSDRYPTRCLRSAIELLAERNADFAQVNQVLNTKRIADEVDPSGELSGAVQAGPAAFARALAGTFTNVLDRPQTVAAVGKLKAVRDKRLAHNEAAHPVGPTWQALGDLVRIAQQFVGVAGWAFFSRAYFYEGRYFLSDDARRTSLAMARLADQIRGAKHP